MSGVADAEARVGGGAATRTRICRVVCNPHHTLLPFCTPRSEVADRILALREHIVKELMEELPLIADASIDVKRK